MVYTIAGVAVVVTGAGVAYYLTESVGGMMVLTLGRLALLTCIETEHYYSWSRFAEEIE